MTTARISDDTLSRMGRSQLLTLIDELLDERDKLSVELARVHSDLRPAVLWFAWHMERKLRDNDHKSGWGSEGFAWLLSRLREEVEELSLCPCAQRISEAADVANFAMMIADHAARELGVE